jgi:hypothetical protein
MGRTSRRCLPRCTISELLFERDDLPSFVRLNVEFGALASSGRDIILVTRPMEKMMANMYAAMMKEQHREVHVCQSRQDVEQLRHAKERDPPP